jgi:hypothetical protein
VKKLLVLSSFAVLFAACGGSQLDENTGDDTTLGDEELKACVQQGQTCNAWSGTGPRCCSGPCLATDYSGYGTCGAPLENGAYCRASRECKSGRCYEGRCVPAACLANNQPCGYDSSCCSGYCAYFGSSYTDDHYYCSPKAANGSYCSENAGCLSNKCVSNKCSP